MLLPALLVSLLGLAQGFLPFDFKGTSLTHGKITRRAVLRKTAEVCRDIAEREGRHFDLTIDDGLTAWTVQGACLSSRRSVVSAIRFQASLLTLTLSNGLVDVVYLLGTAHHVTDEAFEAGRDIITRGKAAVKASVRRSSFFAGQWALGSICHTVQDFYSHSNWVEMGKKVPYDTLIQPDRPFVNLAGPDVPTCRSCEGSHCENNILPEILRKGILTSSYFGFFSRSKPPGKCSHGGFFDRSSYGHPTGGINKDDVGASHGSLHFRAAALAVDATADLLEDIRVSVGDKNFLRFMGVSQASVLCLVVDTTESMSEVIEQVKRVAFSLIERNQQEPPAYILVPFNDPDVGPVMMSRDAEEFKANINSLSIGGGGDVPEMSLSGLQLALTAAPPYSKIFVFTDAPAKDQHLRSSIQALIESSKSTVTFMKTSRPRRGRRWSLRPQGARAEEQLYKDLASASGGLDIEVKESELHDALALLEDSSDSSVVTVFQVEMTPKRKSTETFRFTLDASFQKVWVYVTGNPSLTFKLTSPSGVSQTSSELSGRLGSTIFSGNLRRLSLHDSNTTGLWEISVTSNDAYVVKVTGQNSINFIFSLMERFEGAHGDISLKEGRLLAGGDATLMVTLTGSDSVEATEVSLRERSGRTRVSDSLQPSGDGTYLAEFTAVPAGDYDVLLRGEDGGSSFQRQSSTRIKTSRVSIKTQRNESSIEPGTTVRITITVVVVSDGTTDDDATGTFQVKVNNDRGFHSGSPSSLFINGGTASGSVTLTVPPDASSGSDVTLTIVVENNADASDVNYAVLRFSVIAKVTDVERPVFETIDVSKCPQASSCSSSTWSLITKVTDPGGSGISAVRIHQGEGTLDLSAVVEAGGQSATVANYSASCCSQKVVLAAVDGVGNVGTFAATNRAGLGFSVGSVFWSSLLVSLLFL